MKKLILSVTAIAGFSVGALAQGTITFDTSSSTTGLVSISGVLDTATDINAELLYSSTATGTFSPVVTLLLSSSASTTDIGQVGYATGDITDDGNGTLYSDQGASFILPGIAPSATGYFEIEGWLGSSQTYAGATGAKGTTAVFAEVLTSASSPTQASLDQAPALNLVTTAVPEPSTLAMAGVGLASMLIFRRKNS
jgi:hypothetical protein